VEVGSVMENPEDNFLDHLVIALADAQQPARGQPPAMNSNWAGKLKNQ
jgi:hypothetical protein